MEILNLFSDIFEMHAIPFIKILKKLILFNLFIIETVNNVGRSDNKKAFRTRVQK